MNTFSRHELKRLLGLRTLLASRPNAARLLVLGASFLVTALILALLPEPLSHLEERLGVLGWTLNPDDSLEQRITIVAIDEKSLAEVGPWPWPRETMAELSRKVDAAGAQLQLHDIVYAETMAGDTELAQTLASVNAAVIAQVPVLHSNQPIRTGLISHAVNGVNCAGALANTQNYIAPNSAFAGIAKGHITPRVDFDGSIRQLPALICVDGQAYPALSLSVLFEAVSVASWDVRLQRPATLLGPAQELQLSAYPGLSIPLDDEGNMRISYRAAPDSFQAISAIDVLNGEYPPEMLDNTWVLIGATAFGMDDIVPTPYGGTAPGVEIQARILASLLNDSIPYTPAMAGFWLLLVLPALFALSLYVLTVRGDRMAAYSLPVAGLLLPAVSLALHNIILANFGLWTGWLFPALFGLTAAAGLLLLELSRVRYERSRVYHNLHSYLPEDVAREVAYSLPSSSINARRREVTLLSADLRNFSSYGEARPPEEAAAVLHFFFVKATEAVEKHGGHLHEFKGDGLLAVWDDHSTKSARQALAAAQEMQEMLSEELANYAPRGLPPLALGIGLEQGPVLSGSIGPAHRRTHTLLGETVTIVLRIQELTSDLAQPILLGECVARQLDEQSLESQGSYLLAGLKNPHVLFAPPASGNGNSRPNSSHLRIVVSSAQG